MNVRFYAFAALLLASVTGGYAVTWNLTDSVTGTEGSTSGGPVYNTGGFFVFDGVNDYFDTNIAVNYSTSFSISAWFKKNTTAACTDGGPIMGREYQWRIMTGAACEIIVNIQNSSGGDRTHYNASLSFTNQTWRHVIWTYDSSNNRSVVYVDGILRSNITQQGIKQVSATYEWMFGGSPFTGLYANGSIANVTVWNTTLNQVNVTYLGTNATPYCTNLRNWWSFSSTNVSCLTGISNISFNSTSPSTPVSIIEPNNQTFSYTLTNPSSLTTISEWRLNGTNITSCYNATSCTFTGNYTSAGTYTYNVTVVSSQNNISYQWALTVNQSHGSFVNITIGNVPIRYLPEDFRRYHVANRLGTPQYYSGNGSLINATLQAAAYNSVKVKGGRWDIDFGNICQSYSGNASAPCVWSTNSADNYANINIHKAAIAIIIASGGRVSIVNDGPSRWMADNSSKCTYGSNAPDFNYTSCDFANYTIAGNAVAQYMIEVGCTTTYAGMCDWEGRNEPYNIQNASDVGPGPGTYYYRNNTVTCAQRVAGMVAEEGNLTPIIRGRIGTNVTYLSASANYGYSACGIVFSKALMGNFTYGNGQHFDLMNIHEYSSNAVCALTTNYATVEAAMQAGGYGSAWALTEGECNSDSINTYSPEVHGALLADAFIYSVKNTTVQENTFFEFYSGETYIMWNGTLLSTPRSIIEGGLVMNASKYMDDAQTTVYPCTTTSASVSCVWVLKNNTEGVLMFANKANLTMFIDTVTINGSNITAAVSNTNASTFTVSSANVINASVRAYGFDGWNMTIQGPDVTPPTITNRSEWANATMLQVNITCNEACNASINFGTNFTTLGNRSNITAFSLTNQSFNLTPMLSNTTYHYNLTVCDATGNCATYGIYSEPTLPFNIAFSSTSPSTPVSIAEPNNQTFSYILYNPSGFSTTTTWRLNGTNISSCYNSTSCNFTGNYTSAGTYTYNVTVVSSQNNISYQWALTVNDTPLTYTFITAKDLWNNASITNFSVVIGPYGLSSDSMCRQPIATTGVSCGGTGGGNYTFSSGVIDIGFDKPYGAIGMILESREGAVPVGIINTTIPDSCWNAYPTWVRLQALSSSSSSLRCYNGTGFTTFTNFIGGGSQTSGLENKTYFYDDNMSTGIVYISSISNWTLANGHSGGTQWGVVAHFNMSNVSQLSINRSTTNGTIIVNSTELDFTRSQVAAFTSSGYFSRTYTPASFATNFTAQLFSGIAAFQAFNQSGGAVTGFTVTLASGSFYSTNTSIVIPSVAFNATFNKTGYSTITQEFTTGAYFNGTLNFSVVLGLFELNLSDPGNVAENQTYNFTANVSANVPGNWFVEWFLGGVSQFTEWVAQTGVSTWQWVIGYQDEGDYNVTVNATFNTSTGFNGTLLSETVEVTVDDTFPVPRDPLSIQPSSGEYEYSIPLLCLIDYTPVAPYHFDFVYSINGSAYTSMNVENRVGYLQFDTSLDAYGTNYSFGCRVSSVSGVSNYTYSDQFRKVDKNNFYLFEPKSQQTYQHMKAYTLGYVMEADNTIGAIIYAGFVDCTGSGLWDYTFRYSDDNTTRVRETFACLNARGEIPTTIGMVLYKNNSYSWESLGCKGLDAEDQYCAVYKTYTVTVR